MAQYLKEDVRERILSAALDIFAVRGFQAATIAEIARRAGVATGNIYRYFPDKDTLFHTAVPPSFAHTLLALLRRRVRSLAGVEDVRGLAPTSPFHVVSENLLLFCLANRLRVVVLLARSDGTRYANFSKALVKEMGRLAVAHHRGLGQRFRVTPALRLALDQVYRHWVAALVEVLVASPREAIIRERIGTFSKYHLAGLRGLFA